MAKLVGMKDISQHERVSQTTILKYIKELPNYPVRKAAGGIWISDTEELSIFWRRYVTANTD